MADEILVVPFCGQGHLFPSIELCKHLASRNFKVVLIISSKFSSTVPSSLRQYPLVQINEISNAPLQEPISQPRHRYHEHHSQIAFGLEKLLSTRNHDPDSVHRPIYAVVDMKMSWCYEIFNRYEIPAFSFFTSGACSAAVEYATWKEKPLDVKAGETRLLPGLPEDMAITVTDFKRKKFPPKRLPWSKFGPERHHPTNPGDEPPWVEAIEPCIGVMINTCDDLERPFLDYVSDLTGKPVFVVGPLFPEQYWKSFESLLHDPEVRPKRESNYTEEEILQWLDSKPRESVVYVSFGSEVNPTDEEYPELAKALEESTRPFIWVIQRMSVKPGRGSGPPGPSGESYFPHGLDAKVGKRGLIIHGWAPQLLILSHPSAGGFISHCGWNSTLEAVVRGVPLLAWPIRGDQYYNAKMVVSYLKVGSMVSEGYPADKVSKEDIMLGLERVLQDEEIRKRSAAIRGKFENGYPASSLASLDAFSEFVNTKFVK